MKSSLTRAAKARALKTLTVLLEERDFDRVQKMASEIQLLGFSKEYLVKRVNEVLNVKDPEQQRSWREIYSNMFKGDPMFKGDLDPANETEKDLFKFISYYDVPELQDDGDADDTRDASCSVCSA